MGIYSDARLDDVTQQFYTDIMAREVKWFGSYRQPPNKSPEAGFKSWLSMCIRNAAINSYRSVRSQGYQLSLVTGAAHDEERVAGSVTEEAIDELQLPAEQDDEMEIKNLMVRLSRKLNSENERVALVCALLYKGKSPTQIAEFLAKERAEKEGLKYDKLSQKEQIKRLNQCKPLVSQMRARIQDAASTLGVNTIKSVERSTCRVFSVKGIQVYSRPWQFVCYYCRKHGIATYPELARRYADNEDERVALENQMRDIVNRWDALPAAMQEEIAQYERSMS